MPAYAITYLPTCNSAPETRVVDAASVDDALLAPAIGACYSIISAREVAPPAPVQEERWVEGWSARTLLAHLRARRGSDVFSWVLPGDADLADVLDRLSVRKAQDEFLEPWEGGTRWTFADGTVVRTFGACGELGCIVEGGEPAPTP